MAKLVAPKLRRKQNRFTPRLEAFEDRSLPSATIPGVTLDPLVIPKFVNPLPDTDLAGGFVYSPSGTTRVTLETGAKVRVPLYQVGAFQIQENLGLGPQPGYTGVPGYTGTAVYGYGTSAATAFYPGRSFEVQSGQPIAVQWTNGLTSNTHLLPVDPTLLDKTPQGLASYTLGKLQPVPTPGSPIFGSATQIQNVTFNSGIPIVPHVHGGHTQAIFDGTPQEWFTPGKGPTGADFPGTTFTYDNSQQAGTIWYHDHAMGITRLNVEAGLAGFYIIHDQNELSQITTTTPNTLPNEKYDFPLAIQDRMFTAPGYVTATDPTGVGGQLFYPADVLAGTTATYPSEHPEFFGDTILVNGQAWPALNVEPRMYRFRVLDGSNARFYDLKLFDQTTGAYVPFFQVGTDDALLGAPVPLTSLLVAPGERADIVIDFSKVGWGDTIIVTNDAKGPFPKGTPVDPHTTGLVMAFRVTLPMTNIPDATLNAGSKLNTITPLTPTPGTTPQDKALFEFTDDFNRLIQYLGTPTGGFATFDGIQNADTVTMVPDPNSPSGFSIIVQWNVYNNTGDVHPIHLHQTSFQIISRQGFNAKVDPVTGVMTNISLTGQPSGPAANEAGWKDTVQMYPGTVTTIVAKFDLPGKYVWHCHILEHEEHDMMHWLNVVTSTAAAQTLSAVMAPSTATTSALVTSPIVVTTPTTTAALLDQRNTAADGALVTDPVPPADQSGTIPGAVDPMFAEFAQKPQDPL
jgi:spore coat protein A